MTLFDTDVLIWLERGNLNAIKVIDHEVLRAVSVQTYMELMQCAQHKIQQKNVRDFLHEYSFKVLPFTENIGHRASIYIEDYSLSSGMRSGDAIIAATAIESNLELISGNKKHFKFIPGLNLKIFRP